MSGLHAACFDPAEAPEIDDEWRRLAELRANAFITPEWARAWWDTRAKGDRPLLVIVRDHGGGLVGALPLMAGGRGPRRALRFAGASLGDLFHPASTAEDDDRVAEAAFSALGESPRDWSRIVLDNAAGGAVWTRHAKAAAGSRPVAHRLTGSVLPYASLAGLDWDSYLAARTKSFRKRVRYLERAIGREHKLEFTQTAEPALLEDDISAFFRLHRMRWGSASSLATDRGERFHRAFATKALARGWLRLNLLKLDGVEAAALYGWRIGNRYCYYNGGLDQTRTRHSVGTLMVAHAIRSAIEEGAGSFELLRGDESYKARFADGERTVETIAIVAGVGSARVASWAEGTLRRVLRR